MNIRKNEENYRLPAMDFASLGDYPAQFRQHLSERGHTEGTIKVYLRCIGRLAERMKAEGVAIEDMDEAQALALVTKPGRNRDHGTYAPWIVKRFVRFLTAQGVGKPPMPPTDKEIARAKLQREYENYLRRQRGLSERTIFHSWRIADRFLDFRFGEETGDLAKITPADIVGFLQRVTARRPPFRDKTFPTHLRNFFRYLFKTSQTTKNLALGIPSVAQRHGARLPRHLTSEQVETLIGAVRSDEPVGRRNYAMVLLLARLGLRAPEVVAMQLDDIDWRAGEVVVRGKGGRHDRVPLPPDVGRAIADYIRLDRASSSRTLFVTDRAPHRPFKDGQILNMILRDAFSRTGLKPPVPYVGSHILRHSLAANLARRGASLEEIGDMLRHRSRASTMIYARLDIDGLRSVAQSWPVAGGAK